MPICSKAITLIDLVYKLGHGVRFHEQFDRMLFKSYVFISVISSVVSPRVSVFGEKQSSGNSFLFATSKPSSVNFHHAKVKVRQMRSGQRFTLSREKHCPLELASQLINHLSDKSNAIGLDPEHKLRAWKSKLDAALQRFRKRQRTCPFAIPSTKLMQKGVDIISEIFFFDALRRCRFKWRIGLARHSQALGLCKHKRKAHSWTDVRMDPADVHRDHPSHAKYSHVDGIVATLVHECVHAFISTYACNDWRFDEDEETPRPWRICSNADCRATRLRNIGEDGHGVVFIQIASHVEAHAKRELGPNIDFGIESSVRHCFKNTSFIMTSNEIESCHIESRMMLRQFVAQAEGIQERIDELTSRGYRGDKSGLLAVIGTILLISLSLFFACCTRLEPDSSTFAPRQLTSSPAFWMSTSQHNWPPRALPQLWCFWQLIPGRAAFKWAICFVTWKEMDHTQLCFLSPGEGAGWRAVSGCINATPGALCGGSGLSPAFQ
ncbi:uncharacterized protein MYCFIDRAFT_85489 [Pseudocercospora fijiensis CIRAD86]|uniref:SprT-like domain-containing protein n=1 Tax=Pseudocercospora fijiensis (strain CIRAD86) TaxID=383855 RepID=M3B2Q2_PSEFD|nr:uncharacterized protein MYCFIDRAFT_85489 [Pseudocercospora fijiensis CIRAD86]EME83643.1 hypothetical protein MYCFIDRAFT_85489 [Pseudocercospora fijiensis CIRAD86]